MPFLKCVSCSYLLFIEVVFKPSQYLTDLAGILARGNSKTYLDLPLALGGRGPRILFFEAVAKNVPKFE